MAKFITTTGASHGIESLIKSSKYYIVLATPYINIHARLRKIIEQKLCDTPVLFILICKQIELRNDELKWLASQDKIQIVNCINLHGKCFMNENTAIVTSMNLYEYSAVNNIEFGFIVERINDADNYNVIYNECLLMLPDVYKKNLKIAETLALWDNTNLFNIA